MQCVVPVGFGNWGEPFLLLGFVGLWLLVVWWEGTRCRCCFGCGNGGYGVRMVVGMRRNFYLLGMDVLDLRGVVVGMWFGEYCGWGSVQYVVFGWYSRGIVEVVAGVSG